MTAKIPIPLKLEHHELHGALVRAIKSGGKTGKAPKSVAAVVSFPRFSAGAKKIEIVIKDVPGAKEKTFVWNLE